MADPGWAARPPEANDTLLKAGAGTATMLANVAAWTSLGVAHHTSAIASTVNTAATAASWIGMSGAQSAVNATELNTALHGLAGWVDVKPAVVSAAVSAYELAFATMRTAEECEANRSEWSFDNGVNPSVFFMLTPRIVSLDVQYFGVMWPNNAAAGASYGATLSALASSLAIVPPVAGMGASPAAPAAAAAATTQGAAEAAAGGGMKGASEGASAAGGVGSQGASAASDMGSQMSSMLGPVQQAMSSVTQLPQGVMQAGQGAMQPLQSMMGMFMNPSMLGGGAGMGGASAAALPASTAGAVMPGAGAGIGGGGAGLGGGGAPVSSFTRPVSAFEPASAGRPVGQRPSGALGVGESPRPTTTSVGSGMGGMPVGHGAAGRNSEGDRSAARVATVRVVDNRV